MEKIVSNPVKLSTLDCVREQVRRLEWDLSGAPASPRKRGRAAELFRWEFLLGIAA
jgi:hypothetical protein